MQMCYTEKGAVPQHELLYKKPFFTSFHNITFNILDLGTSAGFIKKYATVQCHY